jgi:hypothetical protein
MTMISRVHFETALVHARRSVCNADVRRYETFAAVTSVRERVTVSQR